MKIVVAALRAIFILSVPALFLSLSLALAFNSLWLYQFSFARYDVSQVTGISDSDLSRSARALRDYFNNREEFARISVVQNGTETQLLTEEEQLHFRDVKGLVWLDYKVLISSFLIVLGVCLWLLLWRRGSYRRLLARSLIWGGGLGIIIILALAVGSLFDFSGLFLQFHRLVFNNNYWYAPGNMTLLFPEAFWFDAALVCLGLMALLSIVTGAIAIFYLRRKPIR